MERKNKAIRRKINAESTTRAPRVRDYSYKQPAPGEKQRIQPGFFLTIQEVMRDTGFAYDAVIRLIKRGDFKVIRDGNSKRILSDSIIDAARNIADQQ